MRKFSVGVMIGNIHTDHPGRLLTSIYKEMAMHPEVEVHYFLGTEVDSILREITTSNTSYDYQYYTLYDYSSFLDLDLLIVAYGSLHIHHPKPTQQDFLDRFQDVPVVFLEEESDIQNVFTLITDNYNGMSKCIEHLITVHDMQNILFIAGPKGNRDSDLRLQGYLDTMMAYGVEVEPSMVVHGDYSENVDQLVEELLDSNEDVEAIACANDEMTVSVYRVLQKRGLRVGVDIAVTGFDNMEMASYCKPPLTTLWQDTDEMGQEAANMALEILQGKKVKSKRLNAELIVRGSCGCKYDEKNLVNYGTMNSLQNRDIIDVVTSLQKVQHRSWMAPLFIRTLVQSAGSRREFYRQMGEQLAGFGAKSSELLLLKRPKVVEADALWKLPPDVYVVMQTKGAQVFDYEEKDFKKIGLRQIRDEHDDEMSHQHMYFLIFDGSRQYGVLRVEITSEELSFYYIIALQMGVSLRYLELFEKQEEYRLELRNQNEMLEFNSTHDALTGLLNRHGLLAQTEGFVKKNRRKQQVIFMADLDHLKQINDTFGHGGGDTALKEVSRILSEVLSKNAVVGRLGGDEFAGMFLSDEDDCIECFRNKVKKACDDFNESSNLPFYVNISLGCVRFDYSDGIQVQELLKLADERLYDAKKDRRESVLKDA